MMDSLIFFDHWVEWLYLHASKYLKWKCLWIRAKHWNTHSWGKHSSETQDSLVRIHRLSFRFCNAKHLVVKALLLSRLDQSISEILRFHFEQHDVQCNEVTSLVFAAKMLMCLIKCPRGKTPNPRPTSRPKMKPPKRAYLRMPNTNPTRKECKKTSFQKLKL